MTRRNFPRAVKVAVIRRATQNGVIICEKCGLLAKKFQIDHVRPDGLLGEPVLENAELICDVCYGIKNPQDTTAIAKAKRREASAIGARTRPVAKLASAPFARSERSINRQPKTPIVGQSNIARRFQS